MKTESERGCGVIHSRNLKLGALRKNEKYKTKPNNLMDTRTLHFGFDTNMALDRESAKS
jgi:hypothetical protein